MSRLVMEVLVALVSRWFRPPPAEGSWPSLSSPEWDALGPLALRHGVVPLVAQVLARDAGIPAPAPLRQALRRDSQANAARNMLLSTALLEVLRHLQAQGISAVPFKGPVLSESAYGDVVLRQFTDLDILVEPEQVAAALRALAELGFELREYGHIPEWMFRRTSHAYTLVSPSQGGAVVELHWALAEEYVGFHLDPKQLWPHLTTVRLLGATVPSLGAEELLVLLCVHGSKHGWRRLAWVADVAALIRSHPNLSWAEFGGLASELGVLGACALGLSLAHDLFGAKAPARELCAALPAPALAQLQQQVWQSWVDGKAWPDGESERAGLLRFHVDLQQGWLAKARHVLRVAFRPSVEDWLSCPVSEGWYHLLYLIRPLRLLGRRLRPASG